MQMLKVFALANLLSLSVICTASAAEPPLEWDGLQKRQIKGIDAAYVRPGVNLAQYGKVMLEPVQVSFDKDWKPERTGMGTNVSQADRERIKNDLSALAVKTFEETLSKNNGYPVVDTPGPDVMRITAALTDVYITAPDLQSPGRTSTYVMNAGRMTLVAELRDSESGALFARVIDEREARSNSGLQFTNSIENSAEARNVVRQWATILRKRLDAVRANAQSE
jgi:hypothetical protein